GPEGMPNLYGRTPFPPQQLLQHANPFVHVLLLQKKRRQKPDHGILRTVKQHSLRQSFIHNRTRWDLELKPLNESPSPHPNRSVPLRHQLFQLLLQIRANFVYVLQQLLFLDDREELERNPARQRATTERSPMLPGRNRRRKFFLRDKRSQRNSRRDGLRNRDDIRRHSKALERKDRPRSSQPALNLVEDQSGAMLICQGPALPQKFHRAFVNATLTENRLQHNRTRIVVDRRAQSFPIVLLNERHFFEQRLESLAMLLLSRERQRAKRSPVIRTLQRHQPALRISSRSMPRQPGQLDRSLDRLGAAVGKKSSIQSGELAQLLRQRPLIFV